MLVSIINAAVASAQAVEEVPVRNMAVRLGIERGTLQALQKEASVFCGMVVCFCRHLQWHELANVLFSFQVSVVLWYGDEGSGAVASPPTDGTLVSSRRC